MKHTIVSLLALLPIALLAASRQQDKQIKPFRIFDPDTMAKPTAGYSQVAEVSGGKLVYIAGQVALAQSNARADWRKVIWDRHG